MNSHRLKEPPEIKFNTDKLLEAAVETLWEHANPGDSGYERGVIGLVAHLIFEDDWSAAQTAVYDVREQMEQDIADEIEKAEANLAEASRRLAAAEAKRPKGKTSD